MKLKISKFQDGGQVAPQPTQGEQSQGPEQQVAQIAQEIIGQMGPEQALMLAEAIVSMVQGAAQQQAPQGQPVYARNGGKLFMKGRK